MIDHVISVPESSNTNQNQPAIVAFSNFPVLVLDRKHLMRPDDENAIFKFLRHSVDGKH